MIEKDWESERAEGNAFAIGRVNALLLRDPVERVRMDKIVARLDERRGSVSAFNEATIRLCGTQGCREQSHWGSSVDFPRRYASTTNGNSCLWLPDFVLPRFARRLHLDYRMVVYVGDAYRFHDGKCNRGFAKWAWPIDGIAYGEWDEAVACRVRLIFEDVKVEVSV